MRKQNSGVGSKCRKQKSKSELIQEFGELPVSKKINRVIRLYFDKCWRNTLIVNGKFNYKVYNYVERQVLDYCTLYDLTVMYEYMLNMEEYKSMNLYGLLKEAKANVQKEKEEYNNKQIQALKVQEYDSYLSDLLG